MGIDQRVIAFSPSRWPSHRRPDARRSLCTTASSIPRSVRPADARGRTALAPRPGDLSGLRLGLLANTKRNAEDFVEEVAELLESQHGVKKVLIRTKPSIVNPAPPEMLEELRAECDVVVVGRGGLRLLQRLRRRRRAAARAGGHPRRRHRQRRLPCQRRRHGRPAGHPGLPVRDHPAPGGQPVPAGRARPGGRGGAGDRGPARRPNVAAARDGRAPRWIGRTGDDLVRGVRGGHRVLLRAWLERRPARRPGHRGRRRRVPGHRRPRP